MALVDERANAAAAQTGNPAQPRMLAELLDLRLSEHPTIAHEDDMGQAESLAELVHLVGHGRGVAGVPRIDLDSHGPPRLVGEQSVEDHGQLLSVTVMTEASQRTGLALVVAGARVIEHQPSVLQVTSGELGFYARLSREEPVEGGVQLIDLRILHPELLGQGGGVPQPGGRELRAGLDEPLGDHGQHELAFTAGLGSDQRRDPEPAHGSQDGFNVAMRARASDDEGVLGTDELIPPQQTAKGLDLLGGPIGEIGESALADLAFFAPGLAQQNSGGRVTVGDTLDVHGTTVLLGRLRSSTISLVTWVHL